ncbi:hypothetical protein AZI86_12330 [Bdellovibrio bacteriovorus]|uniref:DUF222 domain-containing protein n=1 Tax=Bdellovibrio bacteriovorus TaxID=959 RepID=A0A150WM10_BDEBC|nr:DUF222 domain-containing protein [Bdellovibrio bacteriovorus]KYG64974.1 hypothetical protein AZI86_12330 [Bdellovibrio bacteriovorus]
MSLRKYTDDELIQRIEKLVRTERRITHLVLLHINEIEDRKIHLERGYDGIYSYLTKGLGFSDGAAYRRLQSARLLRQVPHVAEKIEAGTLNLSQLAQVQKCLKEASQKGLKVSAAKTAKILEKLELKNGFETTKALATEFDLPIQTHQRTIPQKDNSVRLEITLSAEQFAELQMAKQLLSHVCPEGQWSEVIAILAEKFNKRKFGGRSLKVVC